MAKTTDIGRTLAAAPLHINTEATAEINEAVAVSNPLILCAAFGAPVFLPKSGNPFKDKDSGQVTEPLVTVHFPIMENGVDSGLVYRARVMRKLNPITENGQLVGYDAETYLQLPSIARGSFVGLDTSTPQAASRLKIWRYMVAQAAEAWFDSQNRGGNLGAGAFDDTPRNIKRISIAKSA